MKAESVTATFGEEQYFVGKYNSFKLGPFSYTTTVREDETAEDALKRANKAVSALANRAFVVKNRQYVERKNSING